MAEAKTEVIDLSDDEKETPHKSKYAYYNNTMKIKQT